MGEKHSFLWASAHPSPGCPAPGTGLDKKAVGTGREGEKRKGLWGQERVGGHITGRGGFWLEKNWGSRGVTGNA